MYTRGETRTLFDTLQTLMKIVGDLKVYDADFKKVYVLYFLHYLWTRDRTELREVLLSTALARLWLSWVLRLCHLWPRLSQYL